MTKNLITVTVTQEDINKGVPCNSGKCAVALALRRQIPRGYAVSVLDRKLQLTQNTPAEGKTIKGFKEYNLPPEATLFIEEFDKNVRNVHPFHFSLEVNYPTSKDTGNQFCTPVSVPFNLERGSEPSKKQLLQLEKELFG